MQNCSKIYKFYRDKISTDIYTHLFFQYSCNITYYIYIFRQTKIDKSNQGEILCYIISINKRNIRERDKI